jgi:hypothetical protein
VRTISTTIQKTRNEGTKRAKHAPIQEALKSSFLLAANLIAQHPEDQANNCVENDVFHFGIPDFAVTDYKTPTNSKTYDEQC